MNLFASSRFFLKLTMIASFQKTNLKIGDIIIKWYSTTNTLQTLGSGLPLCKQIDRFILQKMNCLPFKLAATTCRRLISIWWPLSLFQLFEGSLAPTQRKNLNPCFFCSNAFSLFLEHQKVDLLTITGRLSLLLKLSHLNSKFRQTLGYLNKALNNPAQLRQVLICCHTTSKRTWSTLTWHKKMAMTDYGLSRPCDHSRRWLALVTTTFVKPRLNCDLNFVIKSFR